MPALRCSTCGINYPHDRSKFNLCRVCESRTDSFLHDNADVDWEEKVSLGTAAPTGPEFGDEFEQWRFEQLLGAGFTEGSAFALASDRSVDIHRAVEIAKASTPELAFRIVS